jgi:hypothetical protein
MAWHNVAGRHGGRVGHRLVTLEEELDDAFAVGDASRSHDEPVDGRPGNGEVLRFWGSQ